MSEAFDPRRPANKQQNLEDVVRQFVADMPEGKIAVNLGSGQNPMDGFVNVDSAAIDGVDLVANLFAYPWPIESESVGLVYMSHFLEHVPDWTGFWNEMWRICADNARVVVIGPHANSDRYLQDPTHCQPLLDRKFTYLNKAWRESQHIQHYGANADVNFAMEYNTFKIWHQDYRHRDDSVKAWAEVHERNVIDDCCWFLKAFKTQGSWDAYVRNVEAMAQGRLIAGNPVEGAT